MENTSDYTTQAIKIFLNAFGFVLQDKDSIKLEVYDKNDNKVGEVQKKVNSAFIKVDYTDQKGQNIGSLNAELNTYYRSNVASLMRTSKFDFYLSYGEKTITGEFIIHATEYNSQYCSCSATLMCTNSDGTVTHIVLNRKDTFFDAQIINGFDKERIHMVFNSQMDNGIYHRIRLGEYNKQLNENQYYRKVEVKGVEDNSPDLLLRIAERAIINDEVVVIQNKNKRLAKENTEGFGKGKKIRTLMLQCGNYMQEADYEHRMYGRIRKLCDDTFMIGDVSLLKNLISICYDYYSTEHIDVLFGIERDRTIYQDGTRSLVDTYYGKTSSKDRTFEIRRG